VSVSYDAFIPEKYVSFSAQRMGLYKRIANIESEYDRIDLSDEIIDRYGDMPRPVENLLQIALIRANAVKCGVVSIAQNGNEFRITPAHVDIEVWSEIEEGFAGKMKLILSSKPYISLRPERAQTGLSALNRTLEKYIELVNKKQ
jgi:transcription-repair coupling factor (superfamily II helicase)